MGVVSPEDLGRTPGLEFILYPAVNKCNRDFSPTILGFAWQTTRVAKPELGGMYRLRSG